MHTAQTTFTLRRNSDELSRSSSPAPGRVRLAGVPPAVSPKRARIHADPTVPELPAPGHLQPPAFLRKLKNAAIGTGCDIRLKVAVTGCPVPTLAWFKNNHCQAQDSEEYGALWIRDCKPTDAGIYTCIARNQLGESRTSAVLAVLELEDSEECGEEETFETQKAEPSEGFQDPQQRAVQRVPAEGEFESFTDTSPESTPSSLRTAPDHLAPSEDPGADRSSEESRSVPGAGGGGGPAEEEEQSTSLAQDSPPSEVARQADALQPTNARIRHLGVEPLIRASRSNLAYSSWGSEDSLSVASDAYGSMFSLYRGKAMSIPADLCEDTLVRNQFDSTLEPSHRWEAMAQNQGSQQGAPRPTGLPPTSLKIRPASPKASRAGQPQPTTPLTPRRKLTTPVEYRDTVPSEFEDKARRPKVVAATDDHLVVLDQARRASSCSASPTHSRSGSRTFDRMKYFETFPERRRSFELADGQPWPGFRKSRSFDHADPRDGRGRPSFSDLLESEGRGLLRADSGNAEQRRLFFRQKAASFDERGKYASRARDIELKISEELSRIKKTAMSSMAKPVLRSPVLERAVNRELSSRKALSAQLMEPLSTTVLQWPGLRHPERSQPEVTPLRKPLQRGLATITGEFEDQESVNKEKARVQEPATNHLAQQSDQVGTRQQLSQNPQPQTQPPGHLQPVVETIEKVTSSPDSRAPMTISAVALNEPDAPGESRWKVKPPSPLSKESSDEHKDGPGGLGAARLELELTDAAPRLGLTPLSPAGTTAVQGPGTPAYPGLKIPVREKKDPETVDLKEEAKPLVREKLGRRTSRAKSKKSRPTSLELAESSDDSYVSAGEDPLEPPVFEISITDTLVTVGASVLLKCIITGTPIPQVVWKKDGEILKTSQTHILKAEGERHTLFIPSASTLDGGLYSVSAANEVGLSSCCASVQVRADSTADRRSLPIPTELYSPITSDEEYLSPLEEPVDLTYKGKQALRLPETCEQQCVYEPQSVIETHFKAPPSFQVPLSDQVAVEGQNISLTVCVLGEPKPIIYWLRNREPVKIDSRHYVLEGEKGRFHLNIVSVQRSDSGMYSCKAINEYGTKHCDGKLEVKGRREDQTLTILAPARDITVNAGESACFECEVRGPPDVDVDWLTNGKLVQPALLNCKMHFDGKKCKLLLNSVHEDDTGVYTCKLSTVKDVVPDPPNGAAVVSGVTGRTVTLVWNKPKKLDPSIDPSALTYVIQSQVLGAAQWHILKANIKDTTYTIQSLNKGIQYLFRVQSATSKSCSKPSPVSEPIQLLDRGSYLEEAPCFIDKPDIVYAVENQSSCITCTLNYVQADVTWSRNGVELTNKPRVYELSMPDDDQHMLRIVKVGRADVGEIVVTASNDHGRDTCRIALLLAEAPRFESIMEDIAVSPEETARLAVVVEGKPLPDIHWYKDDVMLVESNHLSFVYDDNECSLVILNTTESDSGVYTCTAKNLAGEVSCKAELTILKGKIENDEPMDDEETILRKMRLLSDYYDVHQEIGRGAFSCVKRVTEKSSKLDYAAKFISFRATAREDAIRELEILSQMDHERFVYFHDAFEKKNSVIIVMELCAQEELFDRLIKKVNILETELRLYIRQILEGISYLHQNHILHLDMKPDNILMADSASESVRICDLGNAQIATPDTPQYCQFGTPEYCSPEIVNQAPVSPVTDIWPVGVIAYICLTGISPFFSENDKTTLLNVKNYDVAFEEKMFANLSRESRGFVIKLLVEDKLRPDAEECLQHPWFSSIFTVKGKVISTDQLKILVSRRKWQRSLINYKSSMVMRSIPELLEDTSGHMNIGMPKHLKEHRLSSVLSSSSDSDDIDEFPFIPMPQQPELLSARLHLPKLRSDEEETSRTQNGVSAAPREEAASATAEWRPPQAAHSPSPRKSKEELDQAKRKENGEAKPEGPSKVRAKVSRKRSTDIEPGDSSSDEDSELQRKSGVPKRGLRKGVSIDSPDSLRAEAVSRRGEFRRGSSADSALALLGAQEGADETSQDQSGKAAEVPGKLKKSMSMELPRRSPSPGRLDDLAAQRRKGGPCQEDYALKLQLMRQRLLRGGSVDSKMSGLRGPLLEHLGIPDDPKQRSSSLERHSLRPPRPEKLAAQPRLARAASSESAPSEELSEGRVLRKSASFSQGEPTVLHRRLGAPLEIPLLQPDWRDSPEPSLFPLKESPSLSALTDPSKCDGSRPPTPVRSEAAKEVSQRPTTPEIKIVAPIEPPKVEEQNVEPEGPYRKIMIGKTAVITHSNLSPHTVTPPLSSANGSLDATLGPADSQRPKLSTPATPAASPPDQRQPEAVTEVKLQMPVRPIRKAKPTPIPALGVAGGLATPALDGVSLTARGAPSPTPGEVEQREAHPTQEDIPKMKVKSSSVGQFLNIENIESEEVFEAKFKKAKQSSLTRSLKHLMRPKSEEKLGQVPQKGENVYRPGATGAPLQVMKGQESLLHYEEEGKSRSRSEQNIPEASKDSSFVRRLSLRFKGAPASERKEQKVREDQAGGGRKLSWSFGRSNVKDRNVEERPEQGAGEGKAAVRQEDSESLRKELKSSPALAVRRKIESTISGISLRFGRSQSEERMEGPPSEPGTPVLQEAKEGKRGPFLSLLRRSTSEAGSLRKVGIPQNQLATQTRSTPSSESLHSETSVSSKPEKASTHGERRSRWDRWGFSRMRRDKAISQPNISLAVASEDSTMLYQRSASDFPPVFHVKLKDVTLLEGDPLTLCSLPAGSPTPSVTWFKEQQYPALPTISPVPVYSAKRNKDSLPCPGKDSPPSPSKFAPSVTKTVSPAPWKFTPTVPSPDTPSVSPLSATISPIAPAPIPASSPAVSAPTPSVSPVGSEASVTPTRLLPTSKAADGSVMGLRHGVPQKPYTFMEEKARGRFGVVRECKENATGKIFMAKIIHYEGENKQTVLQEYEILKALHHDKIMSLHEAYVTPRYLVLISENCLGKEMLYSLIDRFRYSEDDVVGYILQILQGLDYLHSRRIVHLDIKPDNVIVTYLNVVKLVDFGSAHFFNPIVPKPLGLRVGTPEYMSPEMMKGDPIGPPADIWGLGVLVYIMLSGRSPFISPEPMEQENRIKSAQFDLTKCYPNASQNAALFLKRVLCMFPATRPTVKECHANPWLQDNYLMKLRRQTLTFTTTRLKEFLVHHQRKRSESLTKHRVLLRSYSSTQPGPPSVTTSGKQ
ncbi:striated muscle preferentially expressed protein kinase [Scyliorhinus canicula]|uniref:striated muscle preferentially expressed protein kinase n=1 Tax=Scyliorhinus canicula TaxID=7830 RepID=UPI0018F39B99|nr:striated muscle preferentially expressed protein kinase [Scyliorhinus canicula]